MTTNLPAIYPSPDEWAHMATMAKTLISSGMLPRAIDRPEKAMTVMLKGRELGWPPLRSFQHIHVIEGRPTLSAEAMMALIYEKAPGAVVHIDETTNEACHITAARPGRASTPFRFTIDDAKAAGLLSKAVWRNYPRAMLRSRCVSEMARSVFPDALMGCSYTPEELDADVSESGEVVETKKSTRAYAEPREALPPASSAQPQVYLGTSHQEKSLHDLLSRRNIGIELWTDIATELHGKPFTELSKIVPAIKAREEEKAFLPAPEEGQDLPDLTEIF